MRFSAITDSETSAPCFSMTMACMFFEIPVIAQPFCIVRLVLPCDALLPQQGLVAAGQFSGEGQHDTASKPGYLVHGDDIQLDDARRNKALLS